MPFRFFKKFPGGGDGPRPPRTGGSAATFRQRTDRFWQWFASRERELFEQLRAGRLDPDEIAGALAAVAPGFAWELCPSPEEGREGFALSAEGDTTKRLLIRYMLGRAPALEHWTLFGAKQAAADVAGGRVRIGDGEELAFADFRFAVDFDEEQELVDISVHHPRFVDLPEDARLQLTFIALDSALGEDLIESWVGPIDHTRDRTQEQRYDIAELPRQVRAALSLHDLDPDLDPLETLSSFEMENPGDGDLIARADVITGTTRHIELIRASRNPEAEDELRGTGACFAYVMVPMRDLQDGRQVEQRARIEDALAERLAAAGAGAHVGGALGRQYAYVDLILFDEAAAIAAIREVIGGFGFVAAASLRFFAKDRTEEHVRLVG